MKIVQLLYSGLGGHGSVAFSMQQASEIRSDWKNTMVFMGTEALLPEYENLCVQRALPCRYIATTQGQPWRSWANVYRMLADVRPEAIILHSVKAILPCALYARRHGVPLIAVEHQPNNLKKRSEWWVSRALMRLADAVVVLTPEYRASLQAALGRHWRLEKVHCIPNGIDTNVYALDASREKVIKQHRRIGMAARFSGTKRQKLLVDALALLQERDGPQAWSLSLAGDGETLAAVCARVNDLGLRDQVALPGYLGEQELCDWFHSLDIYAHASDGETLSTSLLQAMAMGLPIVGSNVPGIDNLLAAGGGCGLLTEQQTPESLAAVLTRLAEEPELARELGARARALAVREYGQDAMFARYEQLLRSCKKSST
jgi:glycosyltransferase involved in cell wall biosynthesis